MKKPEFKLRKTKPKLRRKRRVAAVQTLTIAENSNANLKKKLTAKEQARKSADAALKGAERQAES